LKKQALRILLAAASKSCCWMPPHALEGSVVGCKDGGDDEGVCQEGGNLIIGRNQACQGGQGLCGGRKGREGEGVVGMWQHVLW